MVMGDYSRLLQQQDTVPVIAYLELSQLITLITPVTLVLQGLTCFKLEVITTGTFVTYVYDLFTQMQNLICASQKVAHVYLRYVTMYQVSIWHTAQLLVLKNASTRM